MSKKLTKEDIAIENLRLARVLGGSPAGDTTDSVEDRPLRGQQTLTPTEAVQGMAAFGSTLQSDGSKQVKFEFGASSPEIKDRTVNAAGHNIGIMSSNSQGVKTS